MTKWIFGVSLALTCLTAPAFAQPFPTDPYSYTAQASRVEAQENELARVQAQSASYATGSNQAWKPVDDGVYGDTSWMVGAEIAALKPYIGLPVGEEFNFEVAPRVWLGYEGASGLGTRFTYWQFEGTNLSGLLDLEAYSLDWDVSQRGRFRNWDAMVFGGLRYCKLGVDLPLAFEGFGPTIGAEVRRSIGDRGIALLGNVRGSLVFDDTINTPFGVSVRDGSLAVWQMQLGVEWSRPMFWSSQLVVRALYEAQQWEGPTLAGLLTPSVSFGGPSISVGIQR